MWAILLDWGSFLLILPFLIGVVVILLVAALLMLLIFGEFK